jgi:hypothetical protein
MDKTDIIARYLKYQLEYNDYKNKEKFVKDELTRIETHINELQQQVLDIIKLEEQNKNNSIREFFKNK